MSSRSGRRFVDQLGEFGRLFAGWILGTIMLIPALIIHLADKITMWRIRRRGGID